MMKYISSTVLGAAVLALGVSAADASITNGFTVGSGVTEGNNDNRAHVAGTTDLRDDASPGGNGVNMGDLTAGEILGIYGRIVGSVDRFFFDFEASGSFEVRFDFDGYDLEGGGSVGADDSGLVIQPVLGGPPDGASTEIKPVSFALLKRNGGSWDEVASEIFETNYTVNTAPGGDPLLFKQSGNDRYRLVIDGSPYADSDNRNNPTAAALYDLNIAAVPLPFAGIMLLTGLGGAAVAYRRRKPA